MDSRIFSCPFSFIYVKPPLLHESYLFLKMPSCVFGVHTWNILKRIHFYGVPHSLFQPPGSKSRRWHLKSQSRDRADSISKKCLLSQSVCCCLPTQLSFLCLPIQVLPCHTYPAKSVSVWGHIYLAIYFLALGFYFLRSCRHHQAGSQCLNWVGVGGSHKQNQPSCALKEIRLELYTYFMSEK